LPTQPNSIQPTSKISPINLFDFRWSQAKSVLPNLSETSVSTSFGESDHFKKQRGYAVTRFEGDIIKVVFSVKIHCLVVHKVDAIVRHEIGHVIDFILPHFDLDEIAQNNSVYLPNTPERRADAIAQLLWGEPIRYDSDDVQSLTTGVFPRPERLGL